MHNSANPKRRPVRRAVALAVLVCFLIFSVSAIVFTIEHEHHVCTGSHCAICFQLHQIEQVGRNMLPACAALALGVAAMSLPGLCLLLTKHKPTRTLVSLSVQMNN